MDSTEKNPPLSYTSRDSLDITKLRDADSTTRIEIDPYLLTRGDVSYTFDFERVYPRDTIVPTIGYYTPGKVKVEISLDDIAYIPVEISRIASFDMRYLRITFQKQPVIEDVTFFHTLTLYQRIQSRYLVESPGGTIDVYSGYTCQDRRYQDSRKETRYLDTTVVPVNTLSIVFASNPLYKNDTDSDGIENLLDNCPNTSNPDQKDRNRDGIGDACSDDDGDSIVGNTDNCPTVANPGQTDKNANSIGDACEFDTDTDGIPDGIDNAIRVPNPDQKDTDSDTIGDVIDNCKLYNPDQLDLDKNGRGDVCDRDEEYKKKNDSDRDGILDFSDNCPKVPNPDQTDIDRDGIGDACDNCKSLQNPDQADSDKNGVWDMCDDTDRDGIEGWRDNCPSLSNADQADDNNDGKGNACSDTDGDAIYDSLDSCPIIYNPKQEDIDSDGVGDICDTEDNRFLESNKYLFMGLIWVFALVFIGGILMLLRKMESPQK